MGPQILEVCLIRPPKCICGPPQRRKEEKEKKRKEEGRREEKERKDGELKNDTCAEEK